MPDLFFKELEFDPVFKTYPDLSRALETWKGWRGANSAPSWSDVKLLDLPSKLLPTTIIVDVLECRQDFRFRYWGSGLTPLYGKDLTGLVYSQVNAKGFRESGLPQYSHVMNEKKPILYGVLFEQERGLIATRVNLRLPIIDEHSDVVKILTIAKATFGDNISKNDDWIVSDDGRAIRAASY